MINNTASFYGYTNLTTAYDEVLTAMAEFRVAHIIHTANYIG
jgi:hypothetical protein